MKKYLILFLNSFLFLTCFTQNYQTVKTTTEAMFSSGGQFIGIKTDSFKIRGTDTVLYSYHVGRQNGDDSVCFTLLGSSWIGDSIIIKPNGVNIFYIDADNWISISTTAGIGQSWVFAELDSGKYIKAIISNISNEQVFSVYDSVKTVTLTVRDSLGNIVSSPINNKTIKLSKNFGLVKLESFYCLLHPGLYGYDCGGNFIIAGYNNPLLGKQNLSWRRIFDYDIDDEFFTHNWSHTFSQSVFYGIDTYDFLRILNRIESSDSLVYFAKRCRRIEYDTTGVPTTYVFISDTIRMSYPLYDWLFDLYPSELNVSGQFNVMYSFNSNRTKKLSSSEFFSAYGWQDTCADLIHTDVFCMSWEWYYFIEGCGGSYGYFNCAPFGSNYGNELLYFKKGTEIFGTQVDCASVLFIEGNYDENNVISFYPNPAYDKIFVFTNEQSSCIELFDFSGKIILKEKFRLSHFIDISFLAKGLYMARIITEKGIFTAKFVKE